MKLQLRFYLIGTFTVLLLVYLTIRYFVFIQPVKEIDDTIDLKVVTDNYMNDRTKLERQVTIVIQYNSASIRALATTVNSFLLNFPLITIIIVSDIFLSAEEYSKFSNTTKILNIPLNLDLLNLIADRHVANHIQTNYLFLAPVGALSFSLYEGLHLIKLLNQINESIIAVLVQKEKTECLKLILNLLQWSIEYKIVGNSSRETCDSILGSHGILMKNEKFKKIGEPFLKPFPEAFYIQTTALKLNVRVIDGIKLQRKVKHTKKKESDRKQMAKILKIKKIVRQDGEIEWYGCKRKTPRCFPGMANSIPQYLREGRWTPPCCLEVLQQTAVHVFAVLKKWNVTFWLEGGSLLGAMRKKNIIPWDYDVDIGIYLQDINNCPFLKNIKSKIYKKNAYPPSVIDEEGYVWEQSTPKEGKFFRVQASPINRLHVDIFPFYSKNGVMTKYSWFSNHPQDKEFPEHYLKPLTTVEFAGVEVPAPNNVKEFLEYKFGKGCVENPQYPDPKDLPFPAHAKHLVINDAYN